jgi:hypothetical protein
MLREAKPAFSEALSIFIRIGDEGERVRLEDI